MSECVRRTDPGQCTPPSPFPPPPPPLGDSRCIHTHTHRPGCVNSWEAGLSNEVAATTRALPPGKQSPKRREEAGGGGRRWSRVGGGNGGGPKAGDAPSCARSGAGGVSRAGWDARAPPAPGWAGGGARPPAGQRPSSSCRGGGGGKVPVTSASRGSGREGRGRGGRSDC